MEFLRFGSQIAGLSHGCCAYDIIQDFSSSPSALTSIQVTDGDSGNPCLQKGELVFLGPTNLDVFKQRLRLGTFYTKEMPCHAFLAVLTDDQIHSTYNKVGKEWLAVLKDHGFEFLRSVRNSVYSDARPPVHLFGLFRNVGSGRLEDTLVPPKAWTDLPECKLSQQEVWDRDKLTFMTESELRKAGAPVWLAGGKGVLPRLKPETEPQNTENAEPDDELYLEDMIDDGFIF